MSPFTRKDVILSMEYENKFPKTLILNANYQAIHVADWEDAMCLYLSGKAEVISFYEDVSIRSVNETFKLPSIIKVNCKKKFVRNYVTLSRNNVFKRDKYKCAYCGGHFTKKQLTVDHIQPISKNGEKKSWENLVTACGSCNHKKADKNPEEARMPLLYDVFPLKWTPKNGLNLGENYPEEWNAWIF